MKHTDNVKNYPGSLADLARDVGNMRYDSVAEFLQSLGDDFMRQAEADRARGREKLASQLEATANELYHAKDKMQSTWKICEPYMK
jgi:hypothetical protein